MTDKVSHYQDTFPHAAKSEIGILSTIISYPEIMGEAAELLLPESFIDERRKVVFEEMLFLHKKGIEIDIIGLSTNLEHKKEFLPGPGIDTPSSYLVNLEQSVDLIYKKAITKNLKHHADLLNGIADDRLTWKFLEDIQKDPPADYPGGLSKFFIEGIGKIQKQFNGKTNWQLHLVNTEPPQIETYLELDGLPIWMASGSSLIVGKKKSRKTLFLVWLVTQFRGDIEKDILFADTEQGKNRAWNTRERIHKLTGKYINILDLRGLSTKERLKAIESAIKSKSFKVVIIDGIRDLISNINDPDQCTEVVTWIERMIAVYGVHICNVLHLNKSNNEARGHIGTELENKAEVIIELEKDEKTGSTIVRCKDSRDRHFDSFAFTHDTQGLPEIINMPVKGEVLTDKEYKENLALIFEGGLLKRGQAIQGIKSYFKVGDNGARYLLADFIKKAWVRKNGKDHSPDTVYQNLTHYPS